MVNYSSENEESFRNGPASEKDPAFSIFSGSYAKWGI
jgi:hypothetical protein